MSTGRRQSWWIPYTESLLWLVKKTRGWWFNPTMSLSHQNAGSTPTSSEGRILKDQSQGFIDKTEPCLLRRAFLKDIRIYFPTSNTVLFQKIKWALGFAVRETKVSQFIIVHAAFLLWLLVHSTKMKFMVNFTCPSELHGSLGIKIHLAKLSHLFSR